MASFCNTLEKFPPPSFVTTTVGNQSRRTVIQKWYWMLNKSKYKSLKNLLTEEANHLTGYVERKGTQLRLEKALMLTKQIQKVAQRWKINDFQTQFLQLQRSIGNFDETTGYIQQAKNKLPPERLPSRQWIYWVIYLALRDAALLVKISIECENTVKLWMGLIASAHHWSDSLVICGILSRIWLVSSNMTEDFIHVIYPCLYEVSRLVTPNKSFSWPDDSFEPPENLLLWIQESMKLPYSQVQAKEFVQPIKFKRKNVNKFGFLEFFRNEQDRNKSTEPVKMLMDTAEFELSHEVASEEEDFGVVVEHVISKKNLKAKQPKSKEHSGTCSPGSLKGAKTHWRKFFVNVDPKLRSEEGRRKLITRIRKYRREETNEKLRAKLLKLKKLVLQSDDNDSSQAETAFSNFHAFIAKHVGRLQKKRKGQQ